jgi:hypothetical protein
MGKPIVPRRAPAAKGSGSLIPTGPKGLTLADVTISHVFRGDKEVTLSGGEIAAILKGTQHLHAPDEKSEFVNAYAMYFEIVGIAETLDLIAEPDDGQITRPLHYLADQLKRIANRVCALDPGSGAHRAAASFRVEVAR